MKEFKNEIDQLFHEKLANRKVVPSADAWQKLESELNQTRKEKSLAYWYVAASVVVLVSLGVYFYANDSHTVSPDTVAQKNTEINSDAVLTDKSETIESESQLAETNSESKIELQEEIKPEAPKEVLQKESSLELKAQIIIPEEKEEMKINNNASEIKTNSEESLPVVAENSIVPNEKVNEDQQVEKPEDSHLAQNTENEFFSEVRIVYKKSDTQPEKKKTFKKIVNLAKDITEGEYGIGDLREAKNELLAFGKRKEKEEQ